MPSSPHRLRVVGDPLELRGQRGRERRAGQLLGPLDGADLGHRHDAGQDRHVAAGGRHPVAQPQVVVGVEEHLGDREVGPGPALADEELGVGLDVGRARMLVRERGHADAEVARLAHQPDQVLGVAAAPSGWRDPLAHRVAGRVAPHRQDVADPDRGQPADHVAQLGDRVVDRGQVGHRQQRGVGGDPLGDRHGGVPGRAAGAVGDRHERRAQRLQLPDRLPQLALALLGLGREELERERRRRSRIRSPIAG